jgi:hypothetical protein
MSQIHVTKAGANHGPFTVEELNAKLAAGEFESTDKSWMEGMAGWLPLTDSAFAGVGVVIPTAAAAAPPPAAAPPQAAPPQAAAPAADPAKKAPSLAEKAKAAAAQAGSSDSEMISKPDANPVIAAVLTWFVFGLGHIIINGQTNKWIWIMVATFVGMILCFLPGMIISIMSIVDAYQTATRLKNGETIGQNEYSFPLLFKICKILDKKATCKNA